MFGVEKLVLSKLYEEGSNKRIFNIDRHVGMVTTHTHTAFVTLLPSEMGLVQCDLSLQAVAGLLADARSLADVAREEASSFRSNYGHDIPLKVRDSDLDYFIMDLIIIFKVITLCLLHTFDDQNH